VKRKLKIHLVEKAEEVLQLALLPAPHRRAARRRRPPLTKRRRTR
jgi:hypothetical protein